MISYVRSTTVLVGIGSLNVLRWRPVRISLVRPSWQGRPRGQDLSARA